MSDWIERVEKLLNLTQSDSDGEALAAIRAANKLVRENDSSWTKLLEKKPGYGISHTFSQPSQKQQDPFTRAQQEQQGWLRQQQAQAQSAYYNGQMQQSMMNAQQRQEFDHIINAAERAQDTSLMDRLRKLRMSLGI